MMISLRMKECLMGSLQVDLLVLFWYSQLALSFMGAGSAEGAEITSTSTSF